MLSTLMGTQSHPLLHISATSLDLPLPDSATKSKDKVVFVMGATCTGKSKLSVDLANRFKACADKMQVYEGLDIAPSHWNNTFPCRFHRL